MAFSSPSSSSQHWNAAAYAANAHFVPVLGQPVLDLLQPQSDERILDLGCGDGVLTEKLVALWVRRWVGIDNLSGHDRSRSSAGALMRVVMDARALVFGKTNSDAVFFQHRGAALDYQG